MNIVSIVVIAVLIVVVLFLLYLLFRAENDAEYWRHEVLRKNREFAEDIKRVSEESTKYGIEIGKRYYLEKKYVNK